VQSCFPCLELGSFAPGAHRKLLVPVVGLVTRHLCGAWKGPSSCRSVGLLRSHTDRGNICPLLMLITRVLPFPPQVGPRQPARGQVRSSAAPGASSGRPACMRLAAQGRVKSCLFHVSDTAGTPAPSLDPQVAFALSPTTPQHLRTLRLQRVQVGRVCARALTFSHTCISVQSWLSRAPKSAA